MFIEQWAMVLLLFESFMYFGIRILLLDENLLSYMNLSSADLFQLTRIGCRLGCATVFAVYCSGIRLLGNR